MDILRHDYKKWNTRDKRGFDCVIIDEVDSMLIDSNKHKTLLSSKLAEASMQELIIVIRKIWDEL